MPIDDRPETEIPPLRIETSTRVLSRVVLMPRGGGNTTAVRSKTVTLARVRFAEGQV